jgi:hypothetical protein
MKKTMLIPIFTATFLITGCEQQFNLVPQQNQVKMIIQRGQIVKVEKVRVKKALLEFLKEKANALKTGKKVSEYKTMYKVYVKSNNKIYIALLNKPLPNNVDVEFSFNPNNNEIKNIKVLKHKKAVIAKHTHKKVKHHYTKKIIKKTNQTKGVKNGDIAKNTKKEKENEISFSISKNPTKSNKIQKNTTKSAERVETEKQVANTETNQTKKTENPASFW